MEKAITGFESYSIDEDGNVFNKKTGKKLKGSISEGGYKYYRLSINNKKTMFYAHRLVAMNFIDNPLNLPVVNHIDGNKLNNNINNLEWVSYSENICHAYKNNLISPRKDVDFYIDDLKNERWLSVPSYENYLISNYGRVVNNNTKRLLKPSISCGYKKITLSKKGVLQSYLIHNLVYCLFNNCSIPEGYVVDHMNANKLDNTLSNLRLVTKSENVLAALYKTNTNKSCKKVYQFDLDGQLIQVYASCAEAANKLKLDSSSISKVCRKINKTCGGFVFRYSSSFE